MSGSTETYSPATGKHVGSVANTDLAVLPQIIDNAREAQCKWRQLSFQERAKFIKKVKQLLSERLEEAVDAVCLSNGKTRMDALATESMIHRILTFSNCTVVPCLMACDWYANNAETYLGPQSIPVGHIMFANKYVLLI